MKQAIETHRAVAAGELDLQPAMGLICERAQVLTQAAGASISLFEDGALHVTAASGFVAGVVGKRLSLEGSLSGWAFVHGEPVLCDDVETVPLVDTAAAREWGVQSFVAVPLYHGEDITGVLQVYSEERAAFGQEHADTLALLSFVLSSALSNASEIDAKHAQMEALARYQMIFQGASIGIVRVDRDGCNVEANPAMEQMLGYTAAELAGMNFREYTHADDVEHNVTLFRELMNGERDSYQLEKRCYSKDGKLIWTQITTALEYDADGKPNFAISMVEDITKRKVAEQALADQARLSEHQALHDALTGLANRRKLFLDLDRDLRDESLTLGIFDLDGFKKYNDTFGHPAGDALLVRLARRLAAAVDGNGTAYRMGGDEFCAVVRSDDAVRVLDEAGTALSEEGEWFSIRSSFGRALIPHEAGNLEDALQLADRRLYTDKRSGHQMSDDLQVRDALVQVIVERNQELARHVNSVAELAAATATRLGLSPDEIACTRVAAELHDIGKAAIPEVILNKPAALDDEEWEFVKRHTLIGERILSAAPALAKIAPIVRSSHERPDGAGYPDGLRTDEIPLGSRIVAVVDAFDAMVSDRPYQLSRTVDDAIAELRRCAGTQFDPVIVEAFVGVLEDTTTKPVAA